MLLVHVLQAKSVYQTVSKFTQKVNNGKY